MCMSSNLKVTVAQALDKILDFCKMSAKGNDDSNNYWDP
ncbi:hypothetical protein B0H40_000173 [Clostridium beijerinckii]|nr:hypothetical protein [Clostridium beijerinckii]